RIEAESYTSQSGTQTVADPNAHGGNRVGYIDNGDWLAYNTTNPTGKTTFTARVASGGTGGTIQIRTESPTGPLLGTATVPNTGGYGTYANITTTLTNGTGPLHLVFTGTGTGGLFDIDSFTLTGGGTGSANLAAGRPATADSSCTAAEGPEKAVNGTVTGGNTDKWCSVGGSKWWRVDLGAGSTVGRFVVRHAGAGGENSAWNTRDFDIQTSPDGTTWTTRATVRGNTANVTTHTVTPVDTRYVRLNVLTPTSNTDTAARIYEFEVYAS
ncbi:carbohydrate-binding protein, partial [Plantactinospora sonchi]